MQQNKLYTEFLGEWCEMCSQFILDDPDKPWCYVVLSKNPNINFEIIQATPSNPWNYEYLSMTQMNKTRETFIRQQFQE
jgi:hypothetical protein